MFTHEVSHDNSVKSLRIVFCSQYKLQTWSGTGCCGIRAVTCVDKRRIGQGTFSYLRSQCHRLTCVHNHSLPHSHTHPFPFPFPFYPFLLIPILSLLPFLPLTSSPPLSFCPHIQKTSPYMPHSSPMIPIGPSLLSSLPSLTLPHLPLPPHPPPGYAPAQNPHARRGQAQPVGCCPSHEGPTPVPPTKREGCLG